MDKESQDAFNTVGQAAQMAKLSWQEHQAVNASLVLLQEKLDGKKPEAGSLLSAIDSEEDE